MKRITTLILVATAIAVTALFAVIRQNTVFADTPSNPGQVAQPDKAAIERSRKQIHMLDNIYKQTIILITDKYVHDEDDFAAGSAAVLLFKRISESGSHHVRLIDATGAPYNDENVAKDEFERQGLKQLKSGAKIYEQVQQVDGKPQLRALTPVPVVMKRCIMCHDHYADAKKDEPIGAISYTVPIE